MTRAESEALKLWPVSESSTAGAYTQDKYYHHRLSFIIGFETAKKDLALSWEDVRKLCSLSFVVEVDLGREISDKQHYEEVLRRFNESKNK